MALYPALIIDALKTVRYPGSGQDIVSSGILQDSIRIEGTTVSFILQMPKANDPFARSLQKAAEATLRQHCKEVGEEIGDITVSIEEPQAQPSKKESPLKGVKHVIAVSSGKGGVGKSTISVNLACALASQGYAVGLLDADISGPSIPKMLHLEDARPVLAEKNAEGRELIVPEMRYGVKVLSIGFFVNTDDAIMWRGGMASNALKQLIEDADWGELDYLLIDLPPGTSDIHLTIVQTLALSGAVVVSTPQQVALADARRGISMFRNEKVAVPVVGLVENMAWFTPAELPSNRYYIFGKEGAKKLAEELGIALLGQIPLVMSIMEGGEEGTPAALQEGTMAAQLLQDMASNVVCRVAEIDAAGIKTERVATHQK